MDHFNPLPDNHVVGSSDYNPNEGNPFESTESAGSFDKIGDDFHASDLEILDHDPDAGSGSDFDKMLAVGGFFNLDDGDNNSKGSMSDNFNLEQLDLEIEEHFSLSNSVGLVNSGGVGDDTGSQSSMDQLLSMKIFEVDHPATQMSDESVIRELANGFAPGSMNNSATNVVVNPANEIQQHQREGVDSLLGAISQNFSGHHQQQQEQHLFQQHEQQQYNQTYGRGLSQEQWLRPLSQDTMEIQSMVDEAIQNQTLMAEAAGFSGLPVNLSQMGSLDLEQEKLKLISRLQEINRRQQQPASSATTLSEQQSKMRSAHMASMIEQQQHPRPWKQPLVTTAPTTVASISYLAGGSGSGETPLQSFLRSGRKGAQTSGVTIGNPVPSKSSMLSQNVAGAPPAASILDAAPLDFGISSSNPFLRQVGDSVVGLGSRRGNASGLDLNGTNQLIGAMDRSASSQDMIRKLSARSVRASGIVVGRNSRQNLLGDEYMSGGASRSRNAAWGVDSNGMEATGVAGRPKEFFRTSGILPKHASDGHLLRTGAIGASMAKTKNRLGSLSRENSLYNLMSNKNRHGSQKNLGMISKDGSYKNLSMLSRQSSQQSMAREDSTGSLLPTKRGGRTSGGSKYKMAGSRSVPHMIVNNGNSSRGPSTSGQGRQQNALW